MINTNYLALSWAISRGTDTYGYNIARLDDRETGQRYRCMGGGCDMIGTVVGEWLSKTHQARLLTVAEQAHATYTNSKRYQVKSDASDLRPDRAYLYGMTHFSDEGSIGLDGACGIDCMVRIAAAIGISLSRNYDKRGKTTGFMVTDYGSAEALRAATIGGN